MTQSPLVDFLLLKVQIGSATSEALPAFAFECCHSIELPLSVHRLAWNAPGQFAYVYLQAPPRTRMGPEQTLVLASALAEACPGFGPIEVSRLACVQALAGFSSAEQAGYHYVVETDAEEGWMPEIARWYETEHLPGLAGVPGCISATRLINHDHGPVSLACYDLVRPDTLGSPPWLAVRGTAWSDRTRPHFTNTLRTMFEVLPASDL